LADFEEWVCSRIGDRSVSVRGNAKKILLETAKLLEDAPPSKSTKQEDIATAKK